jgi:DNA repair protein RecN (Recombination protein N)
MDANFYLKNLIIQNFATFKNQSIRFQPGFNAIIGETGSGKSLVLDALQLILGGRADKKVVRRETDYSLIEAVFACQDQQIKAYLESEGFPVDGHEIIIKRLIYKNGSTKTYINHLSCTVGFLSLFARRCIDIVGQFENQKLLSESYQLHLLDHFSKQLEAVNKYQDDLKTLKQLKTKHGDLLHTKLMREQRLDYLIFQLQEIEKLNPSSQDEESLLKKKSFIINLEKHQKICFQAKEALEGSEGETGLLGQMKFLVQLFTKNPELFSDYFESLTEVEDKLQQIQDHIDNKLNHELEPDDLENVLDRLDRYQNLKRKFGGTVESILQTQVDFLKEKKQLEDLDIDFEEITLMIQKVQQELEDQALKLHETRIKFAKKLADELTKRIRALNMHGATIKIEISKSDQLGESGISQVYFISETNLGEGYFKIKDIASGGELSRILLALRQILSSFDNISIFLFDEIDTGIGGETAICIGKALAEVAKNGQVIAITHLPQIAQFAESLVVVNKDIHSQDKETRTESTVKELVGKMILKEVKAMAQLA